MKEPQQVSAFVADIQRVIERYRAEFNLTLAAAVGALEVVKLELFHQELKASEEDGENPVA